MGVSFNIQFMGHHLHPAICPKKSQKSHSAYFSHGFIRQCEGINQSIKQYQWLSFSNISGTPWKFKTEKMIYHPKLKLRGMYISQKKVWRRIFKPERFLKIQTFPGLAIGHGVG